MSRMKTSVRWTLVPANGKSMEGFPRLAKRRRSAKRRRQGTRESEAETREGPVNLRAAERARHGRRALACKRSRGETGSDEDPGDLRPVERADRGRSAPDLQAQQESVAAARRSAAGARRRSLRYAEHTTERAVGRYAPTRPHGCGTTAGRQELEQRRTQLPR